MENAKRARPRFSVRKQFRAQRDNFFFGVRGDENNFGKKTTKGERNKAKRGIKRFRIKTGICGKKGEIDNKVRTIHKYKRPWPRNSLRKSFFINFLKTRRKGEENVFAKKQESAEKGGK